MNGAAIWRTRLRGAIGNAIVWGVGWGVIGGLAAGVVHLVTGGAWTLVPLAIVAMAVRFAVWGGIVGTAFSLLTTVAWRGRRLASISRIRFGLGAAVLAAVITPLAMQFLNVLSGDGPIAWSLVLDDAPIAAVFAGVVATVTLTLAQRAERRGPGSDGTDDRTLRHRDAHAALGSGDRAVASPASAAREAAQSATVR